MLKNMFFTYINKHLENSYEIIYKIVVTYIISDLTPIDVYIIFIYY